MKNFQVVHVDMDQRGAAQNKPYMQHFQGNGIPYWAVLDKNGKKIKGFVGGQTFASLKKQTADVK